MADVSEMRMWCPDCRAMCRGVADSDELMECEGCGVLWSVTVVVSKLNPAVYQIMVNKRVGWRDVMIRNII